jgi:serine/threonine-protein kinase
MAPEQFQGKAVFASDIYSMGVTMYQMLTGMLPYDTPSPADLERLMRGDLVDPPRARNAAVPAPINDIVMKALAPDVAQRYQRAADLLDAILGARKLVRRTPVAPGRETARSRADAAQTMVSRARGRADAPAAGFCWQCRKPLHARADKCPFCGEKQ